MTTENRQPMEMEADKCAMPDPMASPLRAPVEDDFLAVAEQINGDWQLVLDTWDEFRAKYGYYLRVDVNANRSSFLTQVLWLVHGRRRLPPLLARLAERGLTGASLRDAAAPFLPQAIELQSYVNGQWRPQHALITGRRVIHACDHVCRIAVDGRHRGTGVLIRPCIVATAAHVLDGLVDRKGRQTSDSLKRLEISFFDADDLLSDGSCRDAVPVVASLHQLWLAHYSPPARHEANGLGGVADITDIAEHNGPWDLALIRLSGPPRAGLAGHPLHCHAPPPAKFGVHVLHHPADAPGEAMGLLWSIGFVTQALGQPLPLRWLHDANTDRGSSGAPCFDDNWKIVALHQAGSSNVATPNQTNRAVPIHKWVTQIDELVAVTDDTPYLAHVLDAERGPTPVFGRHDLQANAWRAMTRPGKSAAERTFVILGGRQSGKRFSGLLLAELARRAGCRLVTLDAANSQDDSAIEFARKILGGFGKALPAEVTARSGLTTESRDFRQDILSHVVEALRAAAVEKPIWLVVERLDICDFAASPIVQVIEGLLASLEKDLPRLNLVLIGWQGAAPTAQVEALTDAPRVKDIVEHLWLALAPPGFVPPTGATNILHDLVQHQIALQPVGGGYARAIAAAAAAAGTVRGVIASSVFAHQPKAPTDCRS